MNEKVPFETWQFYNAFKKILGESFLLKLEKKGKRCIYRWSADPSFCEDTQRNPLDRLKTILTRLCEVGRNDIAEACVSMLAETIGFEINKTQETIPDGLTIEDECLDDYPVLTAFHTSIRGNKNKAIVKSCLRKAKQELDETYSSYLNKKQKEERYK